MDGVCLSPTSVGVRMSMSGASSSGREERSLRDTSPRKSVVDVVRLTKSKSQGSRRAEWKIKQSYSMAGQGGSPEGTGSPPTCANSPSAPNSSSLSQLPQTPPTPSSLNHSSKSHLLVLSRQYYSLSGSSHVTPGHGGSGGGLAANPAGNVAQTHSRNGCKWGWWVAGFS